MAYDEDLASRVQTLLAGQEQLGERKMFGGLAFLLAGNMAVGLSGDELMVRLGREDADAALDEPGVGPFDKTGRRMTGWVLVAPERTAADEDLRAWVARGTAFARSLPPK